MRRKTFFLYFLLFLRKKLFMVKKQKLLRDAILTSYPITPFLFFFYFFPKTLEIINFDVVFQPIPKAEKKFLQSFIFYHKYKSIHFYSVEKSCLFLQSYLSNNRWINLYFQQIKIVAITIIIFSWMHFCSSIRYIYQSRNKKITE